jgi:transcription elongation factor SPT4
MGDDSDPVLRAPAPEAWNKSMRCCVACRLVKTLDQFYDQGCDNCPFLEMEGDRERIEDCTTTEFEASAINLLVKKSSEHHLSLTLLLYLVYRSLMQGIAAIMDPATSWAAKWTHHRKHAAGCYALSVHASLPPHIEEILDNHGVVVRQDE